MIYSLNGKILHTEPTFVVIECGGVGYQCYATMNTLRTLPHIGETATIYTQMLVREGGYAGRGAKLLYYAHVYQWRWS